MSIHCIDCPHHDENNPSLCCSDTIQAKPRSDDEFSRLSKMRGYGALVASDIR